MDEMKITARIRAERGSAASRRLRRAGEVPGLLATHGQDPVPLAVGAHEMGKVLRSGAQLVTMQLDQEELDVLVREIQWDTFGEMLLHVDFDRVVRGEKVKLQIPLVFYGEPAGALEGGVFQKHMKGIEVKCLPSAIPDTIEIDVTGLQIGDEIRVKEIVLPEGVDLAEGDPEAMVANVSVRVAEREVEVEEPEGVVEPEVLTEKQEDKD
jgi:large subunit ribosomal protein L25